MDRRLLILCTFMMFVAMIGAYYDMWWHVAGLVDTFFTAAHSLIYTAILIIGFSVLGTVIMQMVRLRTWRPLDIPMHRELALTGAGSTLQLFSGVFDGFYHTFFGFDITIWSPPHLGAIYGGVLIGIGLTSMWFQQALGWVRRIGAMLTMSVSMGVLQFAIAEYNVMDRFGQYPAWFALFEALFFGFLMIWAYRRVGHWYATPLGIGFWIIQLIICKMWQPFQSLNDGVVHMYDFPYALVGGAILFDLINWFWSRAGNDRSLWALFVAAIYFGGLTSEILWQTGRNVTNEVMILSILAAVVGASFAYALVRLIEGYGQLPWWKWFKMSAMSRVKISSVVILTVCMCFGPGAVQSFAHALDGDVIKLAKDLEPWVVALQFFLQIWLGYSLAELILQWNRKKGVSR